MPSKLTNFHQRQLMRGTFKKFWPKGTPFKVKGKVTCFIFRLWYKILKQMIVQNFSKNMTRIHETHYSNSYKNSDIKSRWLCKMSWNQFWRSNLFLMDFHFIQLLSRCPHVEQAELKCLEIRYYLLDFVGFMDYGRSMKPFFIDIQNFRAWADKLCR